MFKGITRLDLVQAMENVKVLLTKGYKRNDGLDVTYL